MSFKVGKLYRCLKPFTMLWPIPMHRVEINDIFMVVEKKHVDNYSEVKVLHGDRFGWAVFSFMEENNRKVYEIVS